VALNSWLIRLVQDIGADLFRMKGVLSFAGEARRYVLHGIHMTLEGRPGKVWQPSEIRSSDIVFIGRNLDEEMLRAGFERCIVPRQALAS
jgi:G3E family GTPase